MDEDTPVEPINSETSFDEMLQMYADRLPKNWDELTYSQQLEWFAHRMLLDAREDIRQREGNQAAKDWGFMSDYQIERRRRREVQSKIGGWDVVPPAAGNFHRTYIKQGTWLQQPETVYTAQNNTVTEPEVTAEDTGSDSNG